MKRRLHQQGIALLIVVLLVLALATAGAIVAGSMATSDVTDSRYQGAAVAAGFAAETGLESAMKQYATSTAADLTGCTSLGGTQTVGGGASFTLSAGLSTDFSSTTFENQYSQCRIGVSGAVAGTSAARLLHAIVDRNLLYGLNPTFNSPAGTGAPNSWTVTPAGTPPPAQGYDYTGGRDPTGSSPTSCSRAIYAVKARDSGGGAGGASGRTLATVPLPNISIAAGQAITVRFDYRGVRINSGDAGCSTNGAASDPGVNADVQIRFITLDSATVPSPSTILSFNTTTTLARTLTTATGCLPTTQRFPADYTSGCASFYNATKGNVSITVQGAGTRTLTSAQIHIYLRGTGAQNTSREAWVDNVEFIWPNGTGMTRTSDWRDCAVSSCPST